jgi:hypothetical protein
MAKGTNVNLQKQLFSTPVSVWQRRFLHTRNMAVCWSGRCVHVAACSVGGGYTMKGASGKILH